MRSRYRNNSSTSWVFSACISGTFPLERLSNLNVKHHELCIWVSGDDSDLSVPLEDRTMYLRQALVVNPARRGCV